MAKFRVLLVIALVFGSALLRADSSSYKPVRVYDPTRNADQDLADAQAEAKRTNRNVLFDIGGNWCVWCRIMDKFFNEHPDLSTLREQNYVTVFINYSPENKNQTFLSRLPKIPGYPHLAVLDGNGKLLQSQDTSKLEQGQSYNPKKMREFLLKWAPNSTAAK